MDEHRNGGERDRMVGDDGSFRAAAERAFSRLGEEVKLDTDRPARTGFSENGPRPDTPWPCRLGPVWSTPHSDHLAHHLPVGRWWCSWSLGLQTVREGAQAGMIR